MLNTWKRKMLILVGCVALLATMGMYIGADRAETYPVADKGYRSAMTVQALPHLLPALQAQAEPSLSLTEQPQAVRPEHNIEMTVQSPYSAQPDRQLSPSYPPPRTTPSSFTSLQDAARMQHELAAQALAAQAADTAAAFRSYEVTAYYLNVREAPGSDSPILRVVEKGDRLQAGQVEGTGWHRLEDGGYVHGDYVKPAEGAPAMHDLSASAAQAVPKQVQEVAIASAVPMPAVRKHMPGEPQKPTSTVKVDSGLTEEHIAEIFEGTALEGHDLEQAILEVEETYGINAYFTIAVMKLESGNGKSKLAKEKNNLFGLNAVGNSTKKAFSFETKADSVHKFGQLISKSYVGKGYTTIEKVASKYCPANPKWASLVKRIMNGDYRKL